MLKPLPKVSGEGWTLTTKIVGIHESGAYGHLCDVFFGAKLVNVVVGRIPEKGLTLDNEMNILSPDGTVYARMIVR